MALPVVIGGLALAAGGKLLSSYYRQHPITLYDIIIGINSLSALETSGWEITLGKSVKDCTVSTEQISDSTGVIVAVLGSYNRGKTYLLNQLCEINLPSGNLIHTEGISLTAGKGLAKNIIFIDTAGTDSAIQKDKLNDKKATEALLREIALHLCSHIVIVVNRLRATDQTYINQILNRNPDSKKSIFIIHNLQDVDTIDDVDKIIQTEVEEIFNASLQTIELQAGKTRKSVKFYTSEQNGINLRHFIFAKDNSKAAYQWNKQSINGIICTLQTNTELRRKLDITKEMIAFINTKLPQLFINNETKNDSASESNQHKIQVEMHTKKGNIVLSHRKELDDLEQNPYKLILSSDLAFDDAGYFLNFSFLDYGQWLPRYNLYETDDEFKVIIELAGFQESSTNNQVTEEAIIIEGNRDDFKQALTNPNVLQQKIPAGKFKLEIRLKSKIQHEISTLERDNGFYKIVCPKKKFHVTILK